MYDIPDATHPEPPRDAGAFLNSALGRAALHAPTSKNWSSSFNYPFGSVYNKSVKGVKVAKGSSCYLPLIYLSSLMY